MRKLYKSSKDRKKEKRELEEKANDNYSYYVGIYALMVFLDNVTTILKITTQIEKGIKDFEVKEEIFNSGFDWHTTVNRIITFFEKKYPMLRAREDFKIMDEKKGGGKVKKVFLATKLLHEADYNTKYLKNLLKARETEVKKAEMTLIHLISIMNVAEECFYSEKLKMDVNERRNIRTILTKYKKGIKAPIIQILEENEFNTYPEEKVS